MVMQEKVIEIIIYLANEMRNNKSLGEIDVKVLEESGYTRTEIGNAMSWLFDKLSENEQIAPYLQRQKEHSRRILHEAEKRVITLGAQGYLIQLRELGVLTDPMVEAVIDRAMSSGYDPISLNEAKLIVSSLIFERDDMKGVGYQYFSQWSDTIH